MNRDFFSDKFLVICLDEFKFVWTNQLFDQRNSYFDFENEDIFVRVIAICADKLAFCSDE